MHKLCCCLSNVEPDLPEIDVNVTCPSTCCGRDGLARRQSMRHGDTSDSALQYQTPGGLGIDSKISESDGREREQGKMVVEEEPAYTLHRQARKRYPIRQYVVHDIDEQWQADLAKVQDIASKNQGYRYILTVIDIFSRYAWARPLKTKRGEEVTAAFDDIFQQGRIPKRIQTDQGREFENRPVRALFQEHGIELFSVKSAYKAALVERFNRTLKHRLWRYFTSAHHQTWTEVLQDAVYAYNHSVHRSIGRKPADVTSADVGKMRDRMHQRPEPPRGADDIHVGEQVRISKVKSVFEKGYLPIWTEEIFT